MTTLNLSSLSRHGAAQRGGEVFEQAAPVEQVDDLPGADRR
ncbi:MAG: hypothetical protein ACRDSL_04240 [Pseudonocardiaceae bacterium]